jgi:large subunit ribosomal protein L13
MKDNKTFSQRKEDVTRQWHEVDAAGQVLGRLATEIAKKLMGKEKVTFTPHVDGGDFVVVKNAEKVVVTRGKDEGKKYYNHSGFPGGLRERSFNEMLARNPGEILRRAVKNMLPKNRLQDKRMARLKIVIGEEHPYKEVKKAE